MIRPEPTLLDGGYGFRRPSPGEVTARGSTLDLLVVWERPRVRGDRRYVLGVDVADGLGGGDRSVIEVVRLGSLHEPAEQVAEYVTDTTAPAALAYTIAAIGQYYRDEDGVEAKVAVEYTHHGLSTIDTLQLHLGYQNQYRWEYYDAADPARRFSTVLGWHTTPSTRPMLIDKLRSALTTLDPITGQPDLITHSPLLHDELQDFQTNGALWEAAAARGAHDDAVMALAIAYMVAYRLQAGESEPLDERRRRRSEQQALLTAASSTASRPDWRNTPATADDQDHWVSGEDEEDLDQQLYDPRFTPR